jgi:ferredoxin
MMKVRVDPKLCQGHTQCARYAPDSFELEPIDGHSQAKFEEVPAHLETEVRQAASVCPEGAIIISE